MSSILQSEIIKIKYLNSLALPFNKKCMAKSQVELLFHSCSEEFPTCQVLRKILQSRPQDKCSACLLPLRTRLIPGAVQIWQKDSPGDYSYSLGPEAAPWDSGHSIGMGISYWQSPGS